MVARRNTSDCGAYPSVVTASRHFHVSSSRGAEISVVVPSMGDSISEGSVASLEKKPGLRCSDISCVTLEMCNWL